MSAPAAPTREQNFSPEDWGEEHGINQTFLPFDVYGFDPIAASAAVRDVLEQHEPTVRTINFSAFADATNETLRGRYKKLEPLVEIHGGWAVNPSASTSNIEFVNPAYNNITELRRKYTVQDTDARLSLLDRLSSYGVVDLGVVAPRFGVKRDSIERFARRHNFGWEEQRSNGLQQMGRTWETLLSWGYTHRQLGDAFGYKPGSIRTTIRRKVSDDFDAPVDPTAPVYARR